MKIQTALKPIAEDGKFVSDVNVEVDLENSNICIDSPNFSVLICAEYIESKTEITLKTWDDQGAIEKNPDSTSPDQSKKSVL